MKRQFAPLTNEGAVGELEERLGAVLPPGYRDFILNFNGGEPENPCFSFPGPARSYGDSIVRNFFSVSDDLEISLEYKFQIYTKACRVPADMLPIGSDFGGNLIVLALAGKSVGGVYFWDHEIEGLEEYPDNPEHLVFLARSFNLFYEGLFSEPS